MPRLLPIFFLASLLPLAAQTSSLQPSTDPVKAALTRVISRQLAAIRADDFPAAYAFATSEIKLLFSPRLFEKMVRDNYPALMENVPPTFGIALDDGQLGVVFLELNGAAGPRVFRYLLKLEPGGWKIAGVEQTGEIPRRKVPLSA